VTSAHFIYIPMVLVVGLILGMFIGGRAARDALELQKKRDEERAARKAKRAAQREEAQRPEEPNQRSSGNDDEIA
jgi:hypothetical protein